MKPDEQTVAGEGDEEELLAHDRLMACGWMESTPARPREDTSMAARRGAAGVLGIDRRTVAACMDGRGMSWRMREALERGLQEGAGSAAPAPGSGSAAMRWSGGWRRWRRGFTRASMRLMSETGSRSCGRTRPGDGSRWSGGYWLAGRHRAGTRESTGSADVLGVAARVGAGEDPGSDQAGGGLGPHGHWGHLPEASVPRAGDEGARR